MTNDIRALADAVRQTPDDADLRAVFADALLEQKDPTWAAMGELVVASRGTTPELAKRARELTQLVRKMGKLPSKQVVRFSFDHGLVRRAMPGRKAFKVPALEELFRRPELSVLTELDLRYAWPTGTRARIDLVKALGRIVPPNARWLGFGQGIELGAILEAYPSLTGLGLFVNEAATVFDGLAGVTRITDLELGCADFGSDVLVRLATSKLPLRRLVIYADGYTPGARELEPFLSLRAFPELESFGFMIGNEKRAVAFLEALFDSPLCARLRSFGVALDDAESVREWLTENRERWADKAIYTGPSSPLNEAEWEEGWDQLGSLLADVDRDAEALSIREDLALIDPKYAWYWDNVGDSRQVHGDLEIALEAYEKATTLDNTLASAWRSKADVLDDLERRDEALAAWRRAVELEPDDAYSHNGLGGALRNLERHDDALQAYATAWRKDNTFYYAPSNRGDIYLKLGRLDEALAEYERCLKPGDDKAEEYAAATDVVTTALVGIAYIWKARGELEVARDYLRRAQRLERDVDAILAEVALAEGGLTDALVFAERACAAEDADDYDRNRSAWILFELGRLDEAAAGFSIVTDAPAGEHALLLEARGREQDALALLERPEPVDEDYCAHHALCRLVARGVLLARAGRKDEAAACYREARLAPMDPVALRTALATRSGAPTTCDGEWCLGAAAAAVILASVIDGAPDEARARAAALGATLETRDPSDRLARAFDLRRIARLAAVDSDPLLVRAFAVVEGNALPRTLRD